MTKKEFVTIYAEKSGMKTKVEAERALDAFLETVQEALEISNEIAFTGFGKFEVVERAERMGRNPKTGEEIKIEAKKAVKFKAGKLLSDAVAAE
ncbi:MAG: HU family DNA-binding protein [Fusobacteriaceae bacterium]